MGEETVKLEQEKEVKAVADGKLGKDSNEESLLEKVERMKTEADTALREAKLERERTEKLAGEIAIGGRGFLTEKTVTKTPQQDAFERGRKAALTYYS